MAVRPIVKIPDPRLRQKSKVVEQIDDSVRELVTDLLDTMYDFPACGVAAPQIGDLRRVFVLDVYWTGGSDRQPRICINPEIIWTGREEYTRFDGCLSVGGNFGEKYTSSAVRGYVTKPGHVRMRYMDLEGKVQEIEAFGEEAYGLQHECDHLDGVLFIDHLSKLKKKLVLKHVEKYQRLTDQP